MPKISDSDLQELLSKKDSLFSATALASAAPVLAEELLAARAEVLRLREAEQEAEVRGATWALEDTVFKNHLGAGIRAAALCAARRKP